MFDFLWNCCPKSLPEWEKTHPPSPSVDPIPVKKIDSSIKIAFRDMIKNQDKSIETDSKK